MITGNQKDLREYLKAEYGIEVTKQAISLLVKNKDYRLRFTPDGKIITDQSAKLLSKDGFGKRAEVIARKKKAISKKKLEKTIAPTPEEYVDDLQKEGPLKVTDSRERIELHKAFQQAEKFRIENEKSVNKLIDIIEVGDRSFNLWRSVRDEIQAIKDRIAIKVRASESDHEAEQIVHDETHRILTSIISGYQDIDDSELKKKLAMRLTK